MGYWKPVHTSSRRARRGPVDNHNDSRFSTFGRRIQWLSQRRHARSRQFPGALTRPPRRPSSYRHGTGGGQNTWRRASDTGIGLQFEARRARAQDSAPITGESIRVGGGPGVLSVLGGYLAESRGPTVSPQTGQSADRSRAGGEAGVAS